MLVAGLAFALYFWHGQRFSFSFSGHPYLNLPQINDPETPTQKPKSTLARATE